jgi:hypothetical protein
MSENKFPVAAFVSVLITIACIAAVFDRIYEIYRIYSRNNSPPSIGNCDSQDVQNMAKNVMAEKISKVITENYFATTGTIDPGTVKTLASPGDPDLPPNVLYSCSARMIFRTGSGEVLRDIVMYTVEKDEEGNSHVKAGFRESKEDPTAEETPGTEALPEGASVSLALVKADEKWGYIDANGKEVVPPLFDKANDFAANGLAPVKKD